MSEQRIAALEAHREGDKEMIGEIRADVSTIKADVADIKQQLARQKGFFAGVMFVLLPIWSVITAVGLSMWEKLTSSGQ